MSQAVIEVRAVSRQFGALRAVDEVDLDVMPGELFGLIGHNGAGKSTLFRMMLGLLEPTAGEIRILGESVHGRAFRAVRRRVGYLPENLAFYDNLRGDETLRYFARLKGVPETQCASLLTRVGLEHAAQRRVSEYSKGMRQRLGLAQALLGTPALLFLDEPTTGLDPEAIREFYVLLAQLQAEGVTMILSSHILAEIQDRVSRLAILRSGRIQACGTVQALREHLELPLRLNVQLSTPAVEGSLRAALYGQGIAELKTLDGGISFPCPREAKMRVLALVAGMGPAIRDIHVQEASLEDVYLGHAT